MEKHNSISTSKLTHYSHVVIIFSIRVFLSLHLFKLFYLFVFLFVMSFEFDIIFKDAHRVKTHEKFKYGHLDRWYIKLTLFKRFKNWKKFSEKIK